MTAASTLAVAVGTAHNDSPLRECWDKIGRAEEHLNALAAELNAFLDSKPFATDEGYNSEQSKYLFKLRIIKPIPQARWALIIGDCVHNARSALDYLAWRLAGSDLTDKATLFPIHLRPNDFASTQWRVARIHADAVIEIGRCQPYVRPNPKIDPLWLLQELDGRDKHKLLAMTQGVAFGGKFGVTTEGEVRGDYGCIAIALKTEQYSPKSNSPQALPSPK